MRARYFWVIAVARLGASPAHAGLECWSTRAGNYCGSNPCELAKHRLEAAKEILLADADAGFKGMLGTDYREVLLKQLDVKRFCGRPRETDPN